MRFTLDRGCINSFIGGGRSSNGDDDGNVVLEFNSRSPSHIKARGHLVVPKKLCRKRKARLGATIVKLLLILNLLIFSSASLQSSKITTDDFQDNYATK